MSATGNRSHLAVGQTSASSGLVSFTVPTEVPGPEEVLVRVLWSVITPIDLWQLDHNFLNPSFPHVLGVNLVGEVVSVGADVDLVPGDKVLSFTYTPTPKGKAIQEYATLSKWNVGKLPANITPQEAVAVPDNLITAYWSLFGEIKLPVPSELPSTTIPEDSSSPILVWGAGGSVGQYTVQLLHIAGYRNIFAVASARHHSYLRSIGASATFDYNTRDVAEQIVKSAGGPVKFVLDTISDEEGSLKPISKVVGDGTKLAFLVPVRVGGHGEVSGVKAAPDIAFPAGVELIGVRTFFYQTNTKFKEELQSKIVPKLLEEGLIKPNRIREMRGDTLLERVVSGMDILRRGEVSGERLVFEVSQ